MSTSRDKYLLDPATYLWSGKDLRPYVVTYELLRAASTFFALLDLVDPSTAPTRFVAEPARIDADLLVRGARNA